MVIDANIREHIQVAPLKVVGRLVDASNATLLCETDKGIRVIYKPIAGERPLWDFPDGNLASREVAAYLISELGGFHLIPFTVLREGPYGEGSVQQWIDIDEGVDLAEYGQSGDAQLRQLALLDAVLNNTDRKFGHLLLTQEGKLFGCDHGVTLHSEPKLRTVLWQWSGNSLTEEERSQLTLLRGKLSNSTIDTLIAEHEISALFNRIDAILAANSFPEPNNDWPAVPWPPF